MARPFPPSGSRFLLLRHGQSEANVQGLIVSGLEAATSSYGLTSAGREQVRLSVTAARKSGMLPDGVHLISSPLLRARESASIASEVLGVTIRVDVRLRERGFGSLELTSDENYEQVWTADREDPAHVKWGVESTTAILSRVDELLSDLTRSEPKATFLLCTHGDVASVSLCAARGVALARHREIGSLENGEIRGLAAGSTATV